MQYQTPSGAENLPKSVSKDGYAHARAKNSGSLCHLSIPSREEQERLGSESTESKGTIQPPSQNRQSASVEKSPVVVVDQSRVPRLLKPLTQFLARFRFRSDDLCHHFDCFRSLASFRTLSRKPCADSKANPGIYADSKPNLGIYADANCNRVSGLLRSGILPQNVAGIFI